MPAAIQWYFEYTHTNTMILIANLIYYSMWFTVLRKCHGRRYGLGVTLAAEFATNLLVLNVASRMLPFMSVVRSVMGYVVLLLVCFVLYKDSKRKIALTLFLLLVLNIFNELLGAFTYFPPEAMAGTPDLMSTGDLIFAFFGPYLLVGGMSMLLLYVFLDRVELELTARDSALLALFPMSQFMMLMGWLKLLSVQRQAVDPVYFSLGMLMCVVADLAMLKVIRGVGQRTRLESEKRLLEQVLEEQTRHYDALTAQYEDIRRMRHDIAKHMTAVEAMLSQGSVDEAKAYVGEMKEGHGDRRISYCRHPVADTFLSSRIDTAAAQGVGTKFIGNIPRDISIANTDLICALGNLLDNAYEACRGAEAAQIALRCGELDGMLVIITENSAGEEGEKAQRIPGLERGVGTRILKALAEKYDGSYSTEEKEGMYYARLVLSAHMEGL